jgi:hypothetical protein
MQLQIILPRNGLSVRLSGKGIRPPDHHGRLRLRKRMPVWAFVFVQVYEVGSAPQGSSAFPRSALQCEIGRFAELFFLNSKSVGSGCR